MVVTLFPIVTLVRRLLAKAKIPNDRNTVWNNHAGEGVVDESKIPNGRHAVSDSHAGEGVAGESTIPNGRNAVWNSHAGEGVDRKHYSQWSSRCSRIVTLVRLL